uniref:Uncharacterized protein n=1 Tax=Arundo donax TaxID=35708 RepID=A0A0A9FYH4_ARUDO
MSLSYIRHSFWSYSFHWVVQGLVTESLIILSNPNDASLCR